MARRILWGLLVASVLAGCSRVKLAYGFLDLVVVNQVEDFLALSGDQHALVKREVQAYLAWHQRAALPQYAAAMRREAALHAQGQFTPESFAQTRALVQRLYRMTAEAVVEPSARVLSTQRGTQVDHLEAQLRERDDELAAMAAKTPEEQLAAQTERFESFFELLLGDVSQAQRAIIARRAQNLASDNRSYLENRRLRNSMLVQMLRRQTPPGELRAFIEASLLNPSSFSGPEGQARFDHFLNEVWAMGFEVLGAMDDAQRRVLVRTLERYAADFEDLAGA